MNFRNQYSLGVKGKLLLLLMAAGALFNSCKKTTGDIPANVGTIRFINSTYSIDLNAAQPLNVVLPLSLPLESDGTAIVTIDSKSTALSTQYTIDPLIPANGIKLTLAKGSTQASFNIASLNNFEGDVTLILKVTSATGGLSVSNTNATTTITIHGKPIVLPAIIPSLAGLDPFGNVNVATVSTPSKTFTVTGTKLPANITIAATDNFKVSLDNVTFTTSVTVTSAAAMAGSVTVYVVFAPNSGTNGPLSGTINLTSGTLSATVNVSGTETGNAVVGNLLLKDDFSYGSTAGSITTASAGAWVGYSAAGANPVLYVTTGLSYTGYVGSGVGGAITHENKTASAEDISLNFTSQTTGVIYLCQMINLSAAPTTADFFTSLGDAPASPTFHNRIYAKSNGSQYSLAVSRNSATTPTYSATNYDYGTTYLVITKYDYTNQTSSMYVLSGAIPIIEPATPDATSLGTPATDAAAITKVIVRQSTNLSLKGTYDGVRVATSWKQAVGK